MRGLTLNLPPSPYDSGPWDWAFVLFRPIPGYPGYGADTLGKIWTCRDRQQRATDHPWREMVLRIHPKSGHLHLRVMHESGQTKNRFVHRLILETFVGPCPKGMETLHRDDNPANNLLSNLRWGSRCENIADRRNNGRQPLGSRVVGAKLKEADVDLIRGLISRGSSLTSIGNSFGVSTNAIWEISKGKSWSHHISIQEGGAA